jgi:N-acyl homoserine lactone hydrolase
MTDKAKTGTAERIYLLDGGLAFAPDKSMYSPGLFVGETVALSCNAYLIRRAGEWILWDTGISDAIFNEIGGKIIAHGIRAVVSRPIEDQLAEIGVTPKEIVRVILSHGHFDHAGNCSLFPHAKWYLQQAEYDAMFSANFADYGYIPDFYDTLRERELEQVRGDLDLFRDQSVRLLATPGHTPGHMSLLVRLPTAGSIILTADAAHFRFNLEHCLVPKINSNIADSLTSMERLNEVARAERAQLWFNHDISQNATIPHAPSWLE